MQVPKKTRLYIEQTRRETEQAPDMHRIFQRDLAKLKLTTARTYVKLLTDGKVSVCVCNKSKDFAWLEVSKSGLGQEAGATSIGMKKSRQPQREIKSAGYWNGTQ